MVVPKASSEEGQPGNEAGWQDKNGWQDKPKWQDKDRWPDGSGWKEKDRWQDKGSWQANGSWPDKMSSWKADESGGAVDAAEQGEGGVSFDFKSCCTGLMNFAKLNLPKDEAAVEIRRVFGLLTSNALVAFLTSLDTKAVQRSMFQNALNAGFPFFSRQQQDEAFQRLSSCGFEYRRESWKEPGEGEGLKPGSEVALHQGEERHQNDGRDRAAMSGQDDRGDDGRKRRGEDDEGKGQKKGKLGEAEDRGDGKGWSNGQSWDRNSGWNDNRGWKDKQGWNDNQNWSGKQNWRSEETSRADSPNAFQAEAAPAFNGFAPGMSKAMGPPPGIMEGSSKAKGGPPAFPQAPANSAWGASPDAWRSPTDWHPQGMGQMPDQMQQQQTKQKHLQEQLLKMLQLQCKQQMISWQEKCKKQMQETLQKAPPQAQAQMQQMQLQQMQTQMQAYSEKMQKHMQDQMTQLQQLPLEMQEKMLHQMQQQQKADEQMQQEGQQKQIQDQQWQQQQQQQPDQQWQQRPDQQWQQNQDGWTPPTLKASLPKAKPLSVQDLAENMKLASNLGKAKAVPGMPGIDPLAGVKGVTIPLAFGKPPGVPAKVQQLPGSLSGPVPKLTISGTPQPTKLELEAVAAKLSNATLHNSAVSAGSDAGLEEGTAAANKPPSLAPACKFGGMMRSPPLDSSVSSGDAEMTPAVSSNVVMQDASSTGNSVSSTAEVEKQKSPTPEGEKQETTSFAGAEKKEAPVTSAAGKEELSSTADAEKNAASSLGDPDKKESFSLADVDKKDASSIAELNKQESSSPADADKKQISAAEPEKPEVASPAEAGKKEISPTSEAEKEAVVQEVGAVRKASEAASEEGPKPKLFKMSPLDFLKQQQENYQKELLQRLVQPHLNKMQSELDAFAKAPCRVPSLAMS